MNLFSIDAETDGLYGSVWAIGTWVGDQAFNQIETFAGMIDPEYVQDPWVREHIIPVVALPIYRSQAGLLEAFWDFWLKYRDNAICLADFGAPVEANLFRTCIERNVPERLWQGPYPLHELGTALYASGVDPDIDRREFVKRPELVAHNPLDDAIVTALCWQKVMG